MPADLINSIDEFFSFSVIAPNPLLSSHMPDSRVPIDQRRANAIVDSKPVCHIWLPRSRVHKVTGDVHGPTVCEWSRSAVTRLSTP